MFGREPDWRDEHESADLVRGDGFESLGTAPGRGRRPARRIGDLNTRGKVVLAGVGVMVVAGVGIIVLSDHAGHLGIGPAPSATPDHGPLPSATPSLSPQPSGPDLGPAPTLVDDAVDGLPPLLRHSLTVDVRGSNSPGSSQRIAFSFSVPSWGWESFGSMSVNKSAVGPQNAEAIVYWAGFPFSAFAGACADPLGRLVPRSAGELAAAVSTAAGTQALTGPSEVMVGGRAAQHVVLAVREDFGCDPGYFFSWHTSMGGAFWRETVVGDTIRVWIVDVGRGRHLFIVGETKPKTSVPRSESDLYDPRTLGKEIEQIVESIRFDSVPSTGPG